MIKFSNVTKKFGNNTVLEKVSFEIKAKEFVFLIGPTGAGKTTLVRLILREYPPTDGSIKVAGFNFDNKMKASQVTELRRKIGIVFQDLKLLMDRTVFENVALPLKIIGQEPTEIKKEVGNVLELVGLSSQADFFPSQLAGGELQRVCIARAVVTKPEIIIADEPTGNLDPATSWQIIDLLQEINKLGRTVLVATHNFEVVDSLKKRVIEMKKGKIVSDQKKGKYKVK
jgi:cell division transport system ATP-binding protein